MESVLAAHVRQLTAGDSHFADFNRFWEVFQSLVKRELQRRGLWSGPPQYLGIAGTGKWNGDSLEDLSSECYRFAVLDRLPGLEQRQHAAQNVDLAIRRNIANCLTELQRRNDPIGYSAFRNAEAAVEMLLSERRLSASGLRGNRVRNETLLSFSGTRRPARTATASELSQALTGLPQWAGLLPRLVRCCTAAQEALAACVSELTNAGIRGFRFRDFVAAVKTETRNYWTHVHSASSPQVGRQDSEADVGAMVPLASSDASVEEDETLARVVNCLNRRIAAIRNRTKRERLTRLLAELLDTVQDGCRRPSLAEMSRRLDVATSTLHDCVKLLREFADECRATESG